MEEIEIKFPLKEAKGISDKLRKLGFRISVGRHREEIECRIEDADTVLRILQEVGFNVRTEYSKYRTVFEREGFNISLDETEAGNYLEVEGPSDEAITKLGQDLGYTEQDFVRRTYAELIGER